MENKMSENIINVKNDIEYSAGSIVSKTIYDIKGGTITLFAFSAGQGLSEHSAPFDAFVEVTDGEAEIVIGGISHILTQCNFIKMPANIPHAVKANKNFKMLLTMIKN
jgi:quercetin dioxygenase-like cupin family protein